MTTPPTPEKKLVVRGETNRNTKRGQKDDTIEHLHDYRVNQHSFTIFVSGEASADFSEYDPSIEYRLADRFERNLNFLSSLDETRPILVHMSAGFGGDWDEGMQMFAAILMCPNPVTVLATKHACSMSSLIPLAADRFVIRPPSRYMIHRGSFGLWVTQIVADAEDRERRLHQEMMLRIYVARLREQGAHKRSSEQRLREMIQRWFINNGDTWFSADEAVHAGFADAVFDGDLKKLRATKQDLDRRARMLEVLRRPVKIDVSVA